MGFWCCFNWRKQNVWSSQSKWKYEMKLCLGLHIVWLFTVMMLMMMVMMIYFNRLVALHTTTGILSMMVLQTWLPIMIMEIMTAIMMVLVYGGDDGGDNESDNDDVDFDGCRECFWNPYVTKNRQSWLGNAVAPHNKNAERRKERYIGKYLTEGRHGCIYCIWFERPDSLTGQTIQRCTQLENTCPEQLLSFFVPSCPIHP